jgi:hypothetical protein
MAYVDVSGSHALPPIAQRCIFSFSLWPHEFTVTTSREVEPESQIAPP